MLELLSDPNAWLALAMLIILELVLGVDNLLFISVVTNKLPDDQRPRARSIGIALALILRLVFLSLIAFIVHLKTPVFDLGLIGPIGEHGAPIFETQFSWRDLILITGGLFLIWKATTELHETIDPHPADTVFNVKAASIGFGSAIVQIILLDMVFSIDSILTAIGMTQHLPIMVTAVIIAVIGMFFAAGPLARLIQKVPTLVTLALSFLLMIGMVLIADGFGVHIPKGYIYVAMGFSVFVEAMNLSARKNRSLTKHPEETSL